MSKTQEALNILLANLYSVYLKTQNYHWNVTGPHFTQLHKLFESQYEEMAGAIDTIAERIRATGGIARGGITDFAKMRSLQDGDHRYSWQQMVQDLCDDHKALVGILKNLAALCTREGEEVTFDLVVARMEAHEKMCWMLSAHLA